MDELWRSCPTPRYKNAKVRLGRVAGRQRGRVSAAQLGDLGVNSTTIARWTREGYLHWVLPGVYAVGHPAPSIEGDLASALLYAGSGAMLSHATALWWLGLSDRKPKMIDLSTARRGKSIRGIRVHGRRELVRISHRGLPVTSVAQTLLDFSSTAPMHRVRRALAEAEYRGRLDLEDVQAACGHGRHGSAKLRRAIARHQPRLAVTRSALEERFLALCESAGLPLPEINATVEGLMVDALWRPQRIIVELDGHAAHGSRAQIERDRQRELRLRAAGFAILRYTWTQLLQEPELVAADLDRALNAAAARLVAV